MSHLSDSPRSRSLKTGRLRLHYVEWSNPGRPTLLLMHGGEDHCRSWDWTADRLKDRYHIIAPDLRGHGDSEWSTGGDYSVSAFIADTAALVDAQTTRPVSIVAHSLGAHIALRYAALYPMNVNRVFAIEGLSLPKLNRVLLRTESYADMMRRWIADLRGVEARERRVYESIAVAAERMHAKNPRLSLEQAIHLTHHGVLSTALGGFVWKFDPYIRFRAPVDASVEELSELWRDIQCPVLMLHGADSRFPNPAGTDAMQEFNALELVTLENAGHWVHHDKFDQFMNLLELFLSRVSV